jgi:hypothetical protein
MFIDFIFDKEIVDLRKDANEKGEQEIVKFCDLARKGNDTAQIFCARVLLDAREKSLNAPISLNYDSWYIRAIKGLRDRIYYESLERADLRKRYGNDYYYDKNEDLKNIIIDICDLALEGDEKAILLLARSLLRQQKNDLAKIERKYGLRSSEPHRDKANAATSYRAVGAATSTTRSTLEEFVREAKTKSPES